MGDKKKSPNTHFRQTPKSFKEQRQTQIFSRIKRNLPYNVYKVSKKALSRKMRSLHRKIKEKKQKLPEFAKRVKIPKKKK